MSALLVGMDIVVRKPEADKNDPPYFSVKKTQTEAPVFRGYGY